MWRVAVICAWALAFPATAPAKPTPPDALWQSIITTPVPAFYAENGFGGRLYPWNYYAYMPDNYYRRLIR